MDLNLFYEMRRHLTIAHHIPGRMRVKFDASIISNPIIKDLLNKNNNSTDKIYTIIPGIENVRINIWACSIIVEYDTTCIKPELIKELFLTGNTDRIKTIINNFIDMAKTS